jgi:hypothetical protein
MGKTAGIISSLASGRRANTSHILEIAIWHSVEDIELIVRQNHAVVAALSGAPNQSHQVVRGLIHQEIVRSIKPAMVVAGRAFLGPKREAKPKDYQRSEARRSCHHCKTSFPTWSQ